MKIEDLILLLNNRLREFKLSRDYSRMNGDLERMNTAEKEVLALEDTLFKLNLLVDTTKSAVVKETTLAEAITDGSVAVLGEYDITSYATDPLHEEKIMNILSKMGVMDTVEKINSYISGKYLGSPVTGEMIVNATQAYKVDTRLMIAMMEQDSSMGTAGLAVSTLNPGNVGNDDDGNTRTYESWQEGVTAVAEWLNRHRKTKIASDITVAPAITTSTTTPAVATSTPTTITSTTTTVTTIPTIATSTSTPAFITSTTTPEIATSTPPSITSTTTPETVTPVTSTSTTTTVISASQPIETDTTASTTPISIPIEEIVTIPLTATSTTTPTIDN